MKLDLAARVAFRNVASPTVEFNSKTPGVDYNVTVVAITAREGQGVQQVSEAQSLSFKTGELFRTISVASSFNRVLFFATILIMVTNIAVPHLWCKRTRSNIINLM